MTRGRKALRLIIAALIGAGIALAWYFFMWGWLRFGHFLPKWVNVAIAAIAFGVLSLSVRALKVALRKAKDY